MQTDQPEINTIDEYITAFPPNVQTILKEIRAVIQSAAPDAVEKIGYGMPTFTLHGNLVHFAAYKKHIGFYPTPSGIEHFRADLSAYETSKGAIRFPLDEPIPYDLIARIVAFRVQENREKAG